VTDNLCRLLSEKGIPKLRKTAHRIKLKGKGHEVSHNGSAHINRQAAYQTYQFSDADRLLSFYREWLDDLFPKATFLDALAMVEKAGHKTMMRNQRLKWIDEGRPKATVEDEEQFEDRPPTAPRQPSRIAPIFEKTTQERPKTPTADDLFGDEDIYNATPQPNRAAPRPVADIPDDDDLDALMAEAEASTNTQQQSSIFGNGPSKRPSQPSGEPDDDDLDALMAEADAQTAPHKPNNNDKRPERNNEDDDDDLEALMAEAEAQAPPPNNTAATSKAKADEDLLDDEEAMAEMDGLW
jgi:replication fork protection complex subunit Csm3/Swi3